MSRLLLIAFVTLAGCQSNRPTLGYKGPNRADDPMLSIDEQKAIGRQKYALVEDNQNIAPKTYIDRPGTTGR